MLSLGIAHKWPLLSLTRICENGKLKVVVRRWRSFLFSFASLHGYYPSPRRGLPFCPSLQFATKSFGNLLRNLHNTLCFIILRTHKSLTNKTIVL